MTTLLARLPVAARWVVLAVLSALLTVPMARVHLPAAFMLGPMIAAIAVQMAGADLRFSRRLRIPAEGLLGGQIAQAITPAALATFLGQVPLFLAMGLSIILISTLVGLSLQRTRSLPGTTALWGTSPGAATVMMLMSGSFGGDERLVAFMQYLRVLAVSLVAPLVAHLWVGPTVAAAVQTGAAGALDWTAFGESLAVVLVGTALAVWLKIPGGTILLPFVLGGALHASGLVAITLPAPLMSVCYVLLGISVGLAFTLAVLRHALGTLPQILASIVVLIGLCGVLAIVVSQLAGVDALSSYLATSPGGLSSVAIIAATANVNLGFVMAMQALRFAMVLLIGPPIARYFAARLRRQTGGCPGAGGGG